MHSATSTSGDEPDAHTPLLPTEESEQLWNIVVLGLCFFFIFSAYNTLQFLITTLLPGNTGFVSLSVLYVSNIPSGLLAPVLCDIFGLRLTLMLGSVCYTLYMLALASGNSIMIVVLSPVVGFGAAILWVAQGVLLTQSSKARNLGFNNGLFWSTFQCSGIVGSLSAYFVLSKLNGTVLFYAASAVSSVGVLGLAFVRPPPRPPPEQQTLSLYKRVLLPMRHATENKNLFRLLPSFFCIGFSAGFVNGEFAKIFAPNPSQQASIPLVFVFWGIAEVFGALCIGKISDKMGRKCTMAVCALLFCSALGVTLCIQKECLKKRFKDVLILSFPTAFLFGVNDSAINVTTSATIGRLFKGGTTVGAFTLFRFTKGVGSTCSYFLPIVLAGGLLKNQTETHKEILIFLQGGMLLFAVAVFMLIDWDTKSDWKSPSSSNSPVPRLVDGVPVNSGVRVGDAALSHHCDDVLFEEGFIDADTHTENDRQDGGLAKADAV